MKDKIFILGIESSCDETAASVVVNGRHTLSNIIATQINIHEKYGGVVPEIASRNHIENIGPVVDRALEDASLKFEDIDAVAVTCGPGLVGALLVGLNYAKALSFAINKPLIGVNHIKGHIFSNFLGDSRLTPPFVSLVVSGGHTHLVYVESYENIHVLGRSKDDAAGECFDKIARAIGLGYPGGPKVEKCAKTGSPNIFFPRAMMGEGNLNFSFSGLKSAVLNHINKLNMQSTPIPKEDIAASFQEAVIHVLTEKSILACKLNNCRKLALAGGVGCNSALRAALLDKCSDNNIQLYMPEPVFCTDNAAMIASCGYYEYIAGNLAKLDLNACANLGLY